MFDVPALFHRSTEPQAAAFILPSCGRQQRAKVRKCAILGAAKISQQLARSCFSAPNFA